MEQQNRAKEREKERSELFRLKYKLHDAVQLTHEQIKNPLAQKWDIRLLSI